MNDTVQFETEKYLCSIQTLQIAMTVRSYKNDKIALSDIKSFLPFNALLNQ